MQAHPLESGWLQSFLSRWALEIDERSNLTSCFGGFAPSRNEDRSPAPSLDSSTTLPRSPDSRQPAASLDEVGSHRSQSSTERRCNKFNVPWFRENQDWCGSKDGREFVSSFFVEKNRVAKGLSYVDGKVSFVDGDGSYPPPTYERRITTNSWQVMLAMAMLEAGLRLTTLQANLKLLAEIMFSQDYAEVDIAWKLAFAGLYTTAVTVWALLGLITAYSYREFIHPDNFLGRTVALGSSALLAMFAIPNDVALLTLHMLPAQLGGLHQESECVEGNRRWPVHTIAHHCKADHDYTNWSGSKVQLPLFVFMDVGCSSLVVCISYMTGVLSFTVLFQMSTTFLYAFVRIWIWRKRWHLRGPLLDTWLKMSTDPCISENRRKFVIAKYIAEGGKRQLLEERLAESESDLQIPHSRASNAAIMIGLKKRRQTSFPPPDVVTATVHGSSLEEPRIGRADELEQPQGEGQTRA
eukprot:TRINITY_DN1509_c0_g1_i1.p1 TRINITY_DN1509_c0_g1~~TRINITY_DN1509_c0_g1_i1.p1  ORF type:complete len:467 (+),score=76.97 TRINITY_DN1509_c0_g1_i1:103-1503(+)